jgi:tetrahydromethanopterin S-methyltransferase subunit G
MKKFIPVIILIIISTNAFANKIEKNVWANNIKTSMPTYFCQSNQVFRQCFTVTADECIEVASSATNVCLKNIDKKIPSKLKMPEEGQKFGGDVGECVGITYGSVLSNKIIKTEKCNKLIYGK